MSHETPRQVPPEASLVPPPPLLGVESRDKVCTVKRTVIDFGVFCEVVMTATWPSSYPRICISVVTEPKLDCHRVAA